MNPAADSPPDRAAKAILFVTIFVAMLGLSVLFPVIQPLGRELGLSEVQVGLFATTYSLLQLLFSPFWGRRSEVQGRKPVLVLGLVGFALSFGLFGLLADLGLRGVLGGSALFFWLLATRVLGGAISSATLPTAQAMMADLSSREDRAAAMGLIGAAFGLGVVFGPAIGALLGGFGLTVPVYFSAALGLLTAAFAQVKLRETRAPGRAQAALPWRSLSPAMYTLLGLGTLYTLASVGMEQTLGYYVQDTFGLDAADTVRGVGGLLVVLGVVSVAIQGFAIRPLSRRFSPPALMLAGLTIMGAGMLMVPGAARLELGWAGLGLAMVGIGVGGALLGPSVTASLSLRAGPDAQGQIAGLNSSALALGRLAGPLIATGMYQGLGKASPYLAGGALLLALTLLVLPLLREVGLRPAAASD